MTVKAIAEKIRELRDKPYFPKVLIAAGILLMVIILMADFGDNDADDAKASDVNADFLTADVYISSTEEKLGEILSAIEGVGKTQVLVNVSSTEEYVFAEEYKQGSSVAESSIVTIDSGSDKTALVKKVNTPDVSGIVIVCEGGDDPKICEKIYKAVSTALNIPTSRIYVAEMK
jgi:stage III sporulation protein AG